MSFYEKAVAGSSRFSRGQVWCHTCGNTRKVDSAECLRMGWPTCCGWTMSLDSPDERKEQDPWDWSYQGWAARCSATKRDHKRCTRRASHYSKDRPNVSPLCGTHSKD